MNKVIIHAKDTKKFSAPNQIPMEQLFLRFPHLSEAICGQLNNKSLATWTGASRSLNMYLTEQKLFEVRIIKAAIRNYHKRKYLLWKYMDRTRWASNAWKEVFKTASKETLATLRHDVQKFYSKMWHQIRHPEKDITPLHFAAIAGNELLFKTLFNKAQDKHPRCADGQTPLHYSAFYGYLEICAFIMAQSEDKNPKSESGDTPLHLAADEGHAEVCDYIIQQVDEKNPRNKIKMTPLHLAAENGDYTVYEIIMSNGGDENLEDEFGQTPAIYLRDQVLSGHLNI